MTVINLATMVVVMHNDWLKYRLHHHLKLLALVSNNLASILDAVIIVLTF